MKEGKDADALIKRIYLDKEGIINVVANFTQETKLAYRRLDQISRQFLRLASLIVHTSPESNCI